MLDWEIMLGDQSYRCDTAYGVNSKTINFYKAITDGLDENNNKVYETYFCQNCKTQLFVFATFLGYFSQKKSVEKQVNKFVRAQQLNQQTRGAETASVLKMIWLEIIKQPENQNKTQKELWTEYCSYADGGIEILLEQWENGDNKLDLIKIYETLLPKIDEFVEQIIPINDDEE